MAWLGALAIGLSLGLLGSGGSILTVPVLIFLAGESEKVAIAESLAIVGGIAMIGALPFALRGRVHWRFVAFFGGPGMAGAYLGAALSRHVSGTVQLALFAVIMLVAAGLMFRPPALSRGGDALRQLDRRSRATAAAARGLRCVPGRDGSLRPLHEPVTALAAT